MPPETELLSRLRNVSAVKELSVDGIVPEMPAAPRSSLVSAPSCPMLEGRLPPSEVKPPHAEPVHWHVSRRVTRLAPPTTAHVTPNQLLMSAALHTPDLSPEPHQLAR